MDLKVVFLGSLPPALAALAEWRNPVTQEAVQRGLGSQTDMFKVQGGPENMPNQVAKFAAETAVGAAEVSAIVPTWIGVTTAVVAAAAEVFPSDWVAIGAGLWTAACGVAAPKLFSALNYRNLTIWNSESRFCRGRSQAECLSRAMILANILAIVAVIAVTAITPAPGHRVVQPASQGRQPE